VALVVMGTGSMLAAALVLLTSDRSQARAAVVQGALPLLTLLGLLVWALA
jgi:putative membrane protein